MKGIEVDPEARTVRAEGGLTWGEFDAATQEHGLAVTGGRVSTTGVAGLALGQRQRLARAQARLRRATTCSRPRWSPPTAARSSRPSDENPDLFWGLRGGGGNFGVVTAFHFRLHPLGPDRARRHADVPGADGAATCCASTATSCSTAPDEVGSGARVHHRAARGVRARAGARPAGDRRRRAATPARSRRARRRCSRCGSSARRPSTWCSRCRTSRCSSCSTPPTRKGMQNYWTADFLRRAARRGDRRAVEHATKPGVAADPDHPRPRRRRHRPGRRGRHGVRAAQRPVEHPLPVDVARPGRHRAQHRLHPGDRRRR